MRNVPIRDVRVEVVHIPEHSVHIRNLRNVPTRNVLIEIEIDKISQIGPVIESGVDAILLDNFTPAEIDQTVREVQNKVVIEASGGITEMNILEYAKARPHFISTGAPIHSSRWLDIGLDWI